MSRYFGLDTSNYTSSAAIFNASDSTIAQSKIPLPVKDGEKGLRQSDALFHHMRLLPEVTQGLLKDISRNFVNAIAVSNRPRNIEGSYMPCFLAGETVAGAIADALGVPLYRTSHQVGHILAALYSSGGLGLINREFIAFHVSGGTTDCLLVTPDDIEIIKCREIGTSLDLKAGQAIDRVGLMLGLKFPCGPELEKLATQSEAKFRPRPKVKDICCSFSGLENLCRNMVLDGAPDCDTALFCLKYIEAALSEMTNQALKKCGNLPIVFAGGVMSNAIIKNTLAARYGAYFAEPCFSSDNAAGIALYAALKDGYKTDANIQRN